MIKFSWKFFVGSFINEILLSPFNKFTTFFENLRLFCTELFLVENIYFFLSSRSGEVRFKESNYFGMYWKSNAFFYPYLFWFWGVIFNLILFNCYYFFVSGHHYFSFVPKPISRLIVEFLYLPYVLDLVLDYTGFKYIIFF